MSFEDILAIIALLIPPTAGFLIALFLYRKLKAKENRWALLTSILVFIFSTGTILLITGLIFLSNMAIER